KTLLRKRTRQYKTVENGYLDIFVPMKLFLALTATLLALFSKSGAANPPAKWDASWIAAPGDDGREYGVYDFRKSIELTAKPDSFIIHVSADNRYKLFVNGRLVSLGPTRGDIYHWNYETVDLASNLK